MNESLLIVKGKLEIKGGGDVSLVPNFGAFLFDSCSYSESGREIETVRDPGIVSGVRAMLNYSSLDTNHMAIGGWNATLAPFLDDTGKTFSFMIPLKHVFNIFNDYPMITCGRQTIRLVRARDDSDCLIIKEKAGSTSVTSVAIKIDTIELKIKHIYPNDEIKIKLMEAIRSDTPILIPFRKWELNELPAITSGTKREIWAVKTTTVVERPRFVIVCFQTNKRSNVAEDPTTFDNVNIASIRLSLNGEYWPNERNMLDFSKNDYAMAYHNYAEFYPSYSHSYVKHPLLSYIEFKKRALFVIDCSKQEETMKSSTVDVRLEFETDIGFPANSKAYCIIIHDCLMEHLPLSEVVKSLN